MQQHQPSRRSVGPVERLDRRLLLAAQVYTTDFGFGTAGHADAPAELLVQPLPDGKVLTVGTRDVPPDPNDDTGDNPGESLVFATRVTAAGKLDRAFGDNGSLELDYTDGQVFLNNRLYVALYGDYPENIVAYTADGELDTIIAGPGGDVISGNGGHDMLYGEGGRDRIYGGEGDDFIDGGSADDVLSGQGGNDTIRGGTGNDRLSGGGGNDQLDGGTGTDFLAAGRGDDDVRAADGTADTTFGGAGRDRARYDRLIDVVAEAEL